MGGGAEEAEEAARRIGEDLHAAAAAGAVGGVGDRLLGAERFPVVGGAHEPDAAVLLGGGLAFLLIRRSVPGDVDVVAVVRRDRAAAVEAGVGLDQVSLRLEAG